jgi:hypothetical protein
VTAPSGTRNIFDRSATEIIGSDLTQVMHGCMFPVTVLACDDSIIATDSSPVQRALPTVFKIKISELINSELKKVRQLHPSRQKKKLKNPILSLSIRNYYP